jgi:16S rRNA (uracil1498-N3)-methyltransferase
MTMTPRLYVDDPQADRWQAGLELALPAVAARHVQVLRLQPGQTVCLFSGMGGQWAARIVSMTRSSVSVELMHHEAVEREIPLDVTLALGMPTNDRMDSLVEKATELGVLTVVPLMTARSVLKLEGERSLKRQAHWQAVAIAACEQSGRNRVPRVAPVQSLAEFLRGPVAHTDGPRWMLSLEADALPLSTGLRERGAPLGGDSGASRRSIIVLSGPEGGLTSEEQRAAIELGFMPISLGPRVLRADTAPLAALASLATWADVAPTGSTTPDPIITG